MVAEVDQPMRSRRPRQGLKLRLTTARCPCVTHATTSGTTWTQTPGSLREETTASLGPRNRSVAVVTGNYSALVWRGGTWRWTKTNLISPLCPSLRIPVCNQNPSSHIPDLFYTSSILYLIYFYIQPALRASVPLPRWNHCGSLNTQ